MFVLTATTTTITTVTYHYCIWSSDCHQHHHHRHHHRVHNHLISHFDCYFNLFAACDHPLLALAHARRCSRPLFLSFYFSISLCFSRRPSLTLGVSVIAAHLERKHNAMMLLMYIMRRDYHRSAYYADYVFLLHLPPRPAPPTAPPLSPPFLLALLLARHFSACWIFHFSLEFWRHFCMTRRIKRKSFNHIRYLNNKKNKRSVARGEWRV